MPAFHRDRRGVVIEPDQLVAFNRSGDVVIGRVLDVQPSHTKIKALDQTRTGRFSRVRRGGSIAVLTEPNGSIPLPVP